MTAEEITLLEELNLQNVSLLINNKKVNLVVMNGYRIISTLFEFEIIHDHLVMDLKEALEFQIEANNEEGCDVEEDYDDMVNSLYKLVSNEELFPTEAMDRTYCFINPDAQ